MEKPTFTPIAIGNLAGIRDALITVTGPKIAGRREAQERILITSLDSETRLYETGMRETDFAGAQRILAFDVGNPTTQHVNSRVIVTTERLADGWYVVEVRKGFYLHSVSDLVITAAQRDIIAKIAADKALVGFKIAERPVIEAPSIDIARSPMKRNPPPAFLMPKKADVPRVAPADPIDNDNSPEEIEGHRAFRWVGPKGRQTKRYMEIEPFKRRPRKAKVTA